ncbi:MAG: TIGR02680 family protein [Lachnospiraceae bacterium]|nr:TIGR02680 family protein [Lachnospiraceae bacterium]
MSERWKMNRIGFVNFWLYDNEEFAFEDGKLLLRGQNGSGKSITTQSFIPFILDGDRNPARLDPFGSKDRRMEYYFLGEEDREEATGYLFLEFKKDYPEQYRTLAIGQRARKGKQMDFWGFVILDGRRVGRDLQFYKEVGSARIPLDKQEIKKILGEETPFTDAPREYKALVNKYLFGFRKPEQYEQFIQLLIKVRAPKLSKDLSPGKIYEILNESLQTLSDEDLRVMVDAMEKMDGIQDSLDQLSRAVNDVTIIRNEYRRYNQYVLGKKGQLYLESKRDAERAIGQLDAQEKQKKDLIQEQKDKEDRQYQVRQELSLNRTKRDSLIDPELENMDRKLETAKEQKAEAKAQEESWKKSWESSQTAIRDCEEKIRQRDGEKDLQREQLKESVNGLEELQETFLWSGHGRVMQLIKTESLAGGKEITEGIGERERLIREGKRAVESYAAEERTYDESVSMLDARKSEVGEKALLEENAQRQVEQQREELIRTFFGAAQGHKEWRISENTLRTVEQQLLDYGDPTDAGRIRELLREDYEAARRSLLSEQMAEDQTKKIEVARRDELYDKIKFLKEQPEVEPLRSASVEASRQKLTEAGIGFIPFYKAVEFDSSLTDRECSRLESQLEVLGILDALIVTGEDRERMKKEFPEYTELMLNVTGVARAAENRAGKEIIGLTVNEELPESLRRETSSILEYLQKGGDLICLNPDGTFRHGVLEGRMDKEETASFVGTLARKRRKEQLLAKLQTEYEAVQQLLEVIDKKLHDLEDRIHLLEQEYKGIQGFEGIDAALKEFRQCQMETVQAEKNLREQENRTLAQEEKKNRSYQKMLQCCKTLPYGRTEKDYEAAEEAVQDYRTLWHEVCSILQQLQNLTSQIMSERDRKEREEELAETAYEARRDCKKRMAEADVLIKQYEEYLNSPEVKEKAKQLADIRDIMDRLDNEDRKLGERLAVVSSDLAKILDKEGEDRQAVQEKIERETLLRGYFEEELALKLVLDRGSKSVAQCAEEAVKLPKEGDLAREHSDVFQVLFKVYQEHNGNLVSYGTSMEDCFENAVDGIGIRKRKLICSTWQGKRLYLEEFYNTLKDAIDETELLIRQKDRELFENILSQTISQQLTDRIADSRRWVKDMSELMKGMDTSMGLSFALDWKPKTAESEQELDTAELEHILLRDRELLTPDDIEKVAAHFRSRIKAEKQRAEETGSAVNYMELVRDALDYRRWFTFQMSYYRNQGDKKSLTNAAFNRFSGGEKAMAMYVPLFAAVNAQYKKADQKDHPRIIALDEAFAGVDDRNISSMFELVETLDFDYIMNSQVLWGCFQTVRGLKIAELLRPLNSLVVTVIHYTWNGKKRILDEQ